MDRRRAQPHWKLRLVTGLSGLLVACVGQTNGHEAQDHTGHTIQPIVGGTASGADQDAVVVMSRFAADGARVGLCTATLVAPNMVVTARHCVSASDPVASCAPDGTPAAGAMVHADYPVNTLFVYVAKNGMTPNTEDWQLGSARGKALAVPPSTTICNNDLAFVVLDKNLDAPIKPIRLGPPSMNEAVTAVGFGIVETGALPAARMQRASVTLLGQGPMAFADDDRYGAGVAEVIVGESACLGDSGSPIVAASGALVGVASRAGNGKARDPNNAASTCVGDTAHAVYTHLGASLDLVNSAFALAGHKPWLEGQPDPRATKPGTVPGAPGTPSASGAEPPKALPPPRTAPSDATPDADTGGGCSASGGRELGSVETAAGILGAMMVLSRLRRRLRRV